MSDSRPASGASWVPTGEFVTDHDRRLWTEPFLLMSAPDDEPCTVAGCRTQSVTRWQVEVIGYQGHGEAPLTGPTFTACLSHLTQQMNRFLPVGGRR